MTTSRSTGRRRTVAAAAVAVALSAAACGEGDATVEASAPTTPAPTVSEPEPTDAETPMEAAAEACDGEVRPTLQEGGHLIGDTEPPVPYSSSPPTSGWHASGAPRLGVIPEDDPLSEPEIVSALENGNVVVAYDPDRVSDETVARIAELATSTYAEQLTVTAYAAAESPVSLAGWGVLQTCGDLDEDALDAFVAAHAGSGPAH